MKVYAHRGASIECPENTLAAFERALELGVYGIELDVRISKDGVPFVLHDDTVDRTTNGTGNPIDLTLAEIQQFDAGAGQRIPALRDVFELVGDRAHFNLEIKDERAAQAMLDLLAEFPQIRWAVSGNALEYVKSQVPDADCWPGGLGSALGSERWAKFIEEKTGLPNAAEIAARIRANPAIFAEVLTRAKHLRATAVSIYYGALEQDVIDRLHEEGLDVWAWTIDDPGEARLYRDRGIDAICTNDPRAMLAL